MDLHTAQQEMARDWIAAYKKYVSPEPLMDKRRGGMPARSTGLAAGDETARRDEDPDTETTPGATATAPAPSAAALSDAQVWVNTKSGVIWKPGSEYYGKTKQGKYMSAADALAAGYHTPAKTGALAPHSPTLAMHSNQKLTKLIAGRTISGTAQADGLLTITFDDGSIMKIKVAPANTNSAATGGKILKVRQEGTNLELDLEGGGSVQIVTAEETSSVMLRDKDGKFLYAD